VRRRDEDTCVILETDTSVDLDALERDGIVEGDGDVGPKQLEQAALSLREAPPAADQAERKQVRGSPGFGRARPG
jgi:hypothetical protein